MSAEREPPRLPSSAEIARAAAVVLAVWALASVLWMGRDLLFVVFLSVLVSAFLSIFVEPLERRRVPHVIATALVATAVLGITAVTIWLVWPTLFEQALVIRRELPRGIDMARRWAEAFQAALSDGSAATVDELEVDLAGIAERLATGVLPIVTSGAGALAVALLVFFGGVYLTAEARLFIHGALGLVPGERRERAQELFDALAYTLRRWVLGAAVNMLAVGVAITAGLALLGIPTALVLGIVSGALEFIPVFGPIIAAAPAVVIAFIVSPGKALSVAVLYLAVQQVQSNLVSPLVMKGAVRLPPALGLFFQGVMVVLFGFIGLIVAVPLLAVIIAVANQLRRERAEGEAS